MEAAELGSEASDEGSLSDHDDDDSESVTDEGLASEPDILLERTDDRERDELEKIEGE
jgi:hypothetical protein